MESLMDSYVPSRGETVDKPKVVLGVSGGIAAYKACDLLRRLTESGHDVRVVPTASALHFVGAATWSALSANPVSTEFWDDVHEVPHVRIGQHADLVVFAPAMHTEMWEHPATTENVATLRRRGALVLEPAVGRLTGVDTGKGRLPEPEEIFRVGSRVVVTAGGTREFLDPVRFLGNSSSGKQGYAFAYAAAARGAQVTLVAANTMLPDPAGIEVVRVTTTEDMRLAVHRVADAADAIVMAAAPSDYRPADYSETKLKKTDDGTAPVLRLAVNPDIAAELGRKKRSDQVLVVFAAETASGTAGLDNARVKLAGKNADMVVF